MKAMTPENKAFSQAGFRSATSDSHSVKPGLLLLGFPVNNHYNKNESNKMSEER